VGGSTSQVPQTPHDPSNPTIHRRPHNSTQNDKKLGTNRIAFEATGMAYPVSRALKRFGYDVTVAHPREFAWIEKSRKKNDRADSLKIAKLHMIGMLPEPHLRREMSRSRETC